MIDNRKIQNQLEVLVKKYINAELIKTTSSFLNHNYNYDNTDDSQFYPIIEVHKFPVFVPFADFKDYFTFGRSSTTMQFCCSYGINHDSLVYIRFILNHDYELRIIYDVNKDNVCLVLHEFNKHDDILNGSETYKNQKFLNDIHIFDKIQFIPSLICDFIHLYNPLTKYKADDFIKEHFTFNEEDIYQYYQFLYIEKVGRYMINVIPYYKEDYYDCISFVEDCYIILTHHDAYGNTDRYRYIQNEGFVYDYLENDDFV